MAGLRKPYTLSSASTTTSGSDYKSTLSGSTSSHGPRFKRYRVQAQGTKDVPEEQVTMVEDDVPLCHLDEEEVYFVSLGPGMAIVDSGATRTIVGEEVWKKWLEEGNFDDVLKIQTRPQVRDFKFGGGEVLRSSYEVKFMAMVKGQQLPICASVVPGPTPFLLARPTLEDWKVKQNYETNELKIGESPWFKLARGVKGHYIYSTSWTLMTARTRSSSLRRSSTTMTFLPLSRSWNLKPRTVMTMCSLKSNKMKPSRSWIKLEHELMKTRS